MKLAGAEQELTSRCAGGYATFGTLRPLLEQVEDLLDTMRQGEGVDVSYKISDCFENSAAP